MGGQPEDKKRFLVIKSKRMTAVKNNFRWGKIRLLCNNQRWFIAARVEEIIKEG